MEKVTLITGASKGIGREFAKIFAKNGYSLLLIARTTSELESLQAELKKNYDCESKILSVDLSDPSAVNTIMNTFKNEMPKLEILINNAGFGDAKKFTDMTESDVNGMLAVNIQILTQLTYRILPFMLSKKSGKILNVSSTAAFSPGPYMAMYYASKSYVLSFSQALYEEYKNDGITVSTLCPGATHTHFASRAGTDKSMLMSGLLPIMTPEKVAAIAYDGLMKNKRVIIPGFFNKLSVFLMWLTPTFINLKILAKMDKPS